MIASNIKGGLCNQMFQIAAGYAHAKRCGTFYGINYGLEHNCIQGHPPTKYKDTLYKNIMTINDVPDDVYHCSHFRMKLLPRLIKNLIKYTKRKLVYISAAVTIKHTLQLTHHYL